MEDIYSFTAARGQVVYFQEQSGDSCATGIYWRCQDATGTMLFDEQLANHGFCGVHDPGTITLTNGGAYTLTVYGQASATGTYQFEVWNVTNQDFTLEIGEAVTNGVPAAGAGNIESPGVEDIYGFTAARGQVVYFQEQSGDSCATGIYWRCQDATGTVLFDEQLANHGFCGVHDPGIITLTNGGAYTLTVYGQASATGTYQFEVWNVTNQDFTIEIGEAVTNGVPASGAGNIETPGVEDIYTFTAAKGQVVYFQEQSGDSCATGIYWRCQDATGTVLFDEQLANHGFCGVHDPGLMTLTNGGAYTISVYGQASATGTYQFQVWPALPEILAQPTGRSGLLGSNTLFTVVADSVTPLTYQWQFNGGNLLGATNSFLALTNLLIGQAGNYDVVVSNNFGAVTSQVAVLTVHSASLADLVVAGINAPATAFAGQPVNVVWQVENQGPGAAIGPWTDTVALSQDATPTNAQPLGSITYSNYIAAGSSLTVTQSIILPGSAAGKRWLVITTDVGAGLTHNTAVAATSTQVLAADLGVESLSAPTAAQFGQAISVTWVVSNLGTAPASGAWSDRLVLASGSNAVVGASVLLTLPAPGSLALGASYTNRQQVILPEPETSTPGAYFLVLEADPNGVVVESTRSNNVLSVPLALTLPPLPDLSVKACFFAHSGAAGTNHLCDVERRMWGRCQALGVWRESVYLTNTLASGAPAVLIGAFTFTNDIPSGAGVTPSQPVVIPLDGPAGNLRVLVVVNSDQGIGAEPGQ